MRALAKFQSGILRVESPPISSIKVVRQQGDAKPKLAVKIRFAFDAHRIVSNGGRTVRLETKTTSNPQLPTALASNSSISPPSFSTIADIESLHIASVKKITVDVFKFDIVKSLPDESFTFLKHGLPIEYSYLLSIPAQHTSYVPIKKSLSDRDYLISKLESGIDPATLTEVFPVPAPGGTSKSNLVPHSSYYTRPIASKSNYRRMKIYSSYQIFEQEVTMSVENFLSATVYEFSYLDYTGTPIEFVEVKIQPSEIYADLLKLQYSSQTALVLQDNLSATIPEQAKYEREIISTTSLISTEFIASNDLIKPTISSVLTSRSARPKVIRTHYRLPNSSRLSIKFSSRVIGLPSRRSKTSSKANSSKPSIIPFYITVDNNNAVAVIKKLPPRAMRVSILARNVTKGDDKFTELTSSRVNNENLNEIAFSLPQNDCSYEVKITSTDKKQRVITSCNSVIFNNLTPYRNAFMKVSRPALIGDQRVKFTIRADFTDAGRQDLLSLIDIINASNVSQTTLSDAGYVSNPNLYSEVFSFRVDKIDFETGEQTYTKEIPLTAQGVDFVDKLDTNSGAAYIFTLGMRSPSSLIPAQSTYKFGTFGGRYLQSLPSNASVIKNSKSGASFETIDSGIKSAISVPTTTLRGSISTLKVSQTMRYSNLIEWIYTGDITEVDHFQIFGAADGAECLLGCSFRETSFEDFELFNRVGVVDYHVRPVYVSYEPGASFSASLYRKSTVPTIILPSFKNGQLWRQPSVTTINSSIVVDTPEVSSQIYEEYFSTEIHKETKRNTSTQHAGASKFESSSGMSSSKQTGRFAPKLTFNLAPIIDSSVTVSPLNTFNVMAIAEAQISGLSTTTAALTNAVSETAQPSNIIAQTISYRRKAE